MHHTIQLLVARADRHDRKFVKIDEGMEEIQKRLVEQETLIHEAYQTIYQMSAKHHDRIRDLRERLEECERRNVELVQRVHALEQGETPDESQA